MPARPQPIDNEAAAFEEIFRRMRAYDDVLRERVFPPGYIINTVGAHIVVTNPAGLTATLVFT